MSAHTRNVITILLKPVRYSLPRQWSFGCFSGAGDMLRVQEASCADL